MQVGMLGQLIHALLIYIADKNSSKPSLSLLVLAGIPMGSSIWYNTINWDVTLYISVKYLFMLSANHADPDQTPQNAAFDQGIHCLLT